MRIYLADLGHNTVTISSDVYPLGVANLAAYVKAHAVVRDTVDVRIFREPQDLKTALDASPPDILGLSSYSWNHNLSLCFARYAKTRHSQTLTLMGGPNFPLTQPEQEAHLRDTPEIDIAVRGPTYEGERAFRNLVDRYAETGMSLAGVQEEPIPGSMWIDRRTGDFVRGEEVVRIVDLDEIPSPYVTGLLDPYFSTGYLPLMQIARGCPFTCSFCNSAVRSNSKVYSHSLENVKADLLYIAQRVQREVALSFADDNFGMYELDNEVADYIAYLQDHFGWPRYIRTTTGKNRGEQIIRVIRKVRGALPMTAAVQSMNPNVLVNIERSNIKLSTYAQIQREVISQGMQSYGELILCLPGESKETFLKGISELMDTGVKRISAHQLMLLHGAPLANPESRRRFGLKTLFRVVARDIGNYTEEPVIETEEMVVSTPTFSFDDYLDCRVFHLLLTIFYYEGNFDEAFELARLEGVKPFDLVTRIQHMLEEAPPQFRQMIDDFVKESREELFPSREACVEWAIQHYEELAGGMLGGNLLSKYSMIGRFYVVRESIDFLHDVLNAVLCEARSEPNLDKLASVMDYFRAIILHVPFEQSLSAATQWTTLYDVETWAQNHYDKDLECYRYSQPVTFKTTVQPDRKALIQNRIRTFGEHPSGLGKFTRTVFARDLRRTLVSAELPRAAVV